MDFENPPFFLTLFEKPNPPLQRVHGDGSRVGVPEELAKSLGCCGESSRVGVPAKLQILWGVAAMDPLRRSSKTKGFHPFRV